MYSKLKVKTMSKQELQERKKKEVKKTKRRKTTPLVNKQLNQKKEEKWRNRYLVLFQNIKKQ